jgi:hypothetical protein
MDITEILRAIVDIDDRVTTIIAALNSQLTKASITLSLHATRKLTTSSLPQSKMQVSTGFSSSRKADTSWTTRFLTAARNRDPARRLMAV